MPAPRQPSYRLHKASGQAVVTINHHDHYLGVHGTPESRLRYERLITTWMAGEPAPAPQANPADATIVELCVMYLRDFAEKHYVKNGKPTSEITNVKRAIRCLRECYAALPVREFSPLKLKACRDRLIQDGLCRSNVNRYAAIMIRIMAYGVENELVGGDVWHALQAVKPLQAGRSEARETDPVGPVSDEDVEATLPHLQEPYRTMCRVMLLSGARPGEIMMLTPAEVDTSGAVWLYRPKGHKSQHKSKRRVIPFGPQAQLLLAPIWPARADQLVFRNSRGHRVTRGRFGEAIVQACRKAGIEPWSPNQLRHSAATKIRAAYDLESAQLILGHSSASTTEIYAERNLKSAILIAERMG